eukprot:3843941-Amphidinium_carterae.1
MNGSYDMLAIKHGKNRVLDDLCAHKGHTSTADHKTYKEQHDVVDALIAVHRSNIRGTERHLCHRPSRTRTL